MASGGTTASTGAPTGGLAGRYAKALYDLADERRLLDEAVDQADGLSRLIDESDALRGLLADPAADLRQSRKALLDVMQQQGFGTLLQHFVGVVADNRRLSDLRRILAGFAALVAQRRGVMVAEVASAHPLSDLQRSQLQARLAEAGFSRVAIDERVDPTLLGGLVVRIGARLYDTSIKSRLSRLHYAMKGAA